MTSLRTDVAYALRMLRRTPGFTAAAVLLLAFGIGVNTLLFSAVSALVTHPLPVADAGGLVDVFTAEAGAAGGRDEVYPLSQPNFEDLRREGGGVFAELAAFAPAAFVLSGRERAERISGYLVTANYFDALGVPLAAGRGFAPGEDRLDGGARVAVLSDALWRKRFGGDPGAVGSTVRLDGEPYTVIGVAPPGFRGTVSLVAAEQIFLPLSSYAHALRGLPRAFFRNRRGLFLRAFGRLKPGIRREAAEAALRTLARRLESEYPDANRGRSFAVRPLADSAVGTSSVMAIGESRRARNGSAALRVAAATVLAIAAANLSSLLLVRFARRSREASIRAALGAPRGRLLAQPLIEAGILCAAGGLTGSALAVWGRGLLRAFAPPFVPAGALDAPPDAGAFAFALAVAAAVALFVAVLPAWRSASTSPAAALAAGGRQGGPGRSERRSTRWLVAAEVALAAVALVGSGLFLRAFDRARRIDPGLRTVGLAYYSLDLSAAGYDGARAQSLCRDLVDAVRALPGVRAAGVSTLPPLGGGPQRTVLRDGLGDDPARVAPSVTVSGVSPGYLAAAGVTLLRGRDVEDSDREGSAPVAVVNEAFVARHWPGEDALGRRFSILGGTAGVRIVGIARTALVATLDETPQPVAYLPLAQSRPEIVSVAAASNQDDAALLPEIERRAVGIDPSLAPFDGSTIETTLAQALWGPRALASLLLLFGALALLLAAFGLYGLVAQSVVQRTQEIGIRMALGADSRRIRGLVLREGAALAAVGAPAGLALAALLARSLTAVLYGLPPLDTATFLLVAAVLAATTALACVIPAQRAIALDPVAALRGD